MAQQSIPVSSVVNLLSFNSNGARYQILAFLEGRKTMEVVDCDIASPASLDADGIWLALV